MQRSGECTRIWHMLLYRTCDGCSWRRELRQPILDALARFSCAQCDAMTAPKIPRGVSVPQTVAPLRYAAMDVKWLPGWEEDVRIKSVNIVDEASNLQHIYPFFETETSEVLLRQYRQWTRAYQRPRWLKVDASRTNLEKRCNERSRQMAPNSWMFLERHMSKSVGSRCTAVISRTCWREFWLRFGQALGPSGLNASTRPRKPRTLSQEGAVTALSR